ncbi:glycosyltransferase family 39 protein [Patescibacteria group bacterium]|nr:glycosyltransferase family 39 protein [Patescibacteria group bacterium]
MNRTIQLFLLILILALASFLRFYKLESIPAGLHADGASQGYNAFSLLNTGKDRYGEPFPILFRSFGSYQPPLYTYLTIIPVAFFGNSPFSAYFISALSGVLLVLITYLFVLVLFNENRRKFVLALIAALTVATAPWSVLFSRLAVEANLGLLLFALSIPLFAYSLRKIQILPIASLVLGISTHAYYSERLIAIIFLPIFVFLFRNILLRKKKWVILAFLLFIITQIPHLLILQSGAFTRRLDQVSSFNNQLNNQSKILNIGKTIINNYLIYCSPKNLFFDSDINLGRTMPGLSAFYNWLIIPFLIGIRYLLKADKSLNFVKIIGLLLIITPISASLTGDFFYPLRTLNFLWVLTLIISLGLFQIYLLLRSNITKLFILGIFLSYSFFSLYISYFILFKYEKAENYGYAYMKLMDKLPEYNNKQIIIDLSRDPGIGIRIAYLKSYPPKKMQDQLRPQLKTPYYNNVINTDEIYEINNIEVKPWDFGDACRNNVIIVGDQLTIYSEQMKRHELKLEFQIPDLSGKVALFGYSTNPEGRCTLHPDL